MTRNRKLVVLAMVCFFVSLTGCAKWNELVERNKDNRPYDEFAEMSRIEIKAFNEDQGNDDKIICESEKPTGSNIPIRICRWESAIRRRAKDDQNTVNNLIHGIVMPAK